MGVKILEPIGALEGLETEIISPLGTLGGIQIENIKPIGSLGGLETEIISPLGTLGGVQAELIKPIGSLGGLQAEIIKPIELVTGGIPVIDTNHKNIHEGEGYAIFVLQEAIANNAKYTFSFKTCVAADGYIHFQWYWVWTNNAKVFMRLWENPTAEPTGGTTVTPYNRNRTDGLTACSEVKQGATLNTAGATLLDLDIFGGGGTTPASRAGGDNDNSGVEWVLKADTYYAFEFENKSGASADILFRAFWYEEELGGL